MDITHEEARTLIHLRSDRGLNRDLQATLISHLNACGLCGKYANQIHETEKTLHSVMQKHWSALPLPQNREVIRAGIKSKIWWPINFAPARVAMVGVTLILFGFVLWQFGLTGRDNRNGLALYNAAQIPTPGTLLATSTQNKTNTCIATSYIVQGNESLDQIAERFSISKESIVELNNLKSESIPSGTELKISNCDLTPTGTVVSPTFTTTPIQEITANTPG